MAISYKDILYYKDKLKNEHDAICFNYIKISETLYKTLFEELKYNNNFSHDKTGFTYKEQFRYEDITFLLDRKLFEFKSEFNIICNVKKITNNYNVFAIFNIEILSEEERAIKEILE